MKINFLLIFSFIYLCMVTVSCGPSSEEEQPGDTATPTTTSADDTGTRSPDSQNNPPDATTTPGVDVAQAGDPSTATHGDHAHTDGTLIRTPDGWTVITEPRRKRERDTTRQNQVQFTDPSQYFVIVKTAHANVSLKYIFLTGPYHIFSLEGTGPTTGGPVHKTLMGSTDRCAKVDKNIFRSLEAITLLVSRTAKSGESEKLCTNQWWVPSFWTPKCTPDNYKITGDYKLEPIELDDSIMNTIDLDQCRSVGKK